MRVLLGIIQLLAVILGILFAALLITYLHYTSDIRYPFEKPAGFVTYDQMPAELINTIKSETRREYERYKVLDKGGSLDDALPFKIMNEGSKYDLRMATILVSKELKGKGAVWGTQVRVMVYSFWVRFHLTENEKIEYILNHEYFGRGCYGIACAALTNFSKKAQDLTPDESAILASFLGQAGRYQPKIEAHYVKKMNELTEAEKADLAKIMTSDDPISRLPPKK